MKLLLAVDENFAIGYQNDLLFHIPEDLKRFKELTTNQIIIMGRKTLESLPNGKPLSHRTNIVLSRNQDLKLPPPHHVVHSKGELFALLQTIDPLKEKEAFLTGGGNLVKELIDYCDGAYLTMIHTKVDHADTHIQNLNKKDGWELLDQSPSHIYKDLTFSYQTWLNNKVQTIPKSCSSCQACWKH